MLHYFSSPGQYILPVVLYNQVFYQVIPLKVNIYEGTVLFFFLYSNRNTNPTQSLDTFRFIADRKAQLSLVVVPIASACVAIVSIAFGIGLYFYTRRKYVSQHIVSCYRLCSQFLILCNLICSLRIEVADFDFEEEDVGNPESFSGRLRSSIVQYWSGLKGQTPPANTSYQNITFD